MAWRYARRPILPVRICVMAELIALYMPMCVSSIAFPGLTSSLKSSLPCLAFSQAVSHSSLINRRMIDLVVAVSVRRESASGGRSVLAPVLGLLPVAAFAAW